MKRAAAILSVFFCIVAYCGFYPGSVPIWGGEFGNGFFKSSGSAPPPTLTLIDWFDPTQGVTTGPNGIVSVANQVAGGPSAGQSNILLQPQLQVMTDDADGDSLLNGMTFDGIADRLEVTLPTDVTTFLVMAFFVPADISAGPPIVGMVDGTVAPLFRFGATSGRFNILLSPGGTTVAQSSGTTIITGSPFAIGMSYDGTTLLINHYIGNGPASSTSAGVKLSGGQTFYIGGAPTLTSFNGQIGDIQIYQNWSGNAAALETQIQTFWNTVDAKYWP